MSESNSHGSGLAPPALAPHHDGRHNRHPEVRAEPAPKGEAQANEPPEVTQTPKRRAGAPRGNRNALKHGRYSAEACAARAAARARLLAAIPDLNVHSSRWQALAGGGGSPLSSAFKTNNYVAQGAVPEPVRPDPRPLEPPRPRGAPPGNLNALKHGRRSAKRRALWKAVQGFMRAVRACLAEVDARSHHPSRLRRNPSRLPRNTSGVAPQGDGCEGRHGEVRAAMLRAPNHDTRVPNHRERPPHAA